MRTVTPTTTPGQKKSKTNKKQDNYHLNYLFRISSIFIYLIVLYIDANI